MHGAIIVDPKTKQCHEFSKRKLPQNNKARRAQMKPINAEAVEIIPAIIRIGQLSGFIDGAFGQSDNEKNGNCRYPFELRELGRLFCAF
jgi:hypothetical protein